MESAGKGKCLGADGWTARGVYSDGPRRLTGRPGPSEVEIFSCGIYDVAKNQIKRRDYVSVKARNRTKSFLIGVPDLYTSETKIHNCSMLL